MTSEELRKMMLQKTASCTDAEGNLYLQVDPGLNWVETPVLNIVELLSELESETSWAKHYSQRAERLEAEIDRMTAPMPCGHPGRYAYTADKEPNDGSTWNCLVCLIEERYDVQI